MVRLSLMFLTHLAARLRAARAAASLTQETAADAAHVSASSLANYEHGRAEIGASTLWQLASIYAVSADWLLTGSTPMPHRLHGAASCNHGTPMADRCRWCESGGVVGGKPIDMMIADEPKSA